MASLKKRGSTWYAQYYIGGAQRRVSLRTDSLQVAKEKVRRLESSIASGSDSPLPTRTPIADVAAAYVRHLRTVKTSKSAQTDIYYLREMFGPVCDELRVTARRISGPAMPQPCIRQRSDRPIEAAAFEQVTTTQIADFIAERVRSRGLAPKTANRYREVIHRLYSWAMNEQGIRLPLDRNPVAKVSRYREQAPEIRFLTLAQIAEQLSALERDSLLRTMVATLIYAGLRREELLWLRTNDLDLHTGPMGMIRVQAKTIADGSWQPKTKTNRAVPISRALRSILDDYKSPRSADGWVFPTRHGGRWDPDNFSRALRHANDRAGLPWSCLDFRHTFGSQLAMKGESLFKIATLLGNSPEICRRHYACLLPESLVGTVEFEPNPVHAGG